jgi:hypothetical protein
MRGRIFGLVVIFALGLFALLRCANAQQLGKMSRVGLLIGSEPSDRRVALYVQKLRDLGYVDGSTPQDQPLDLI